MTKTRKAAYLALLTTAVIWGFAPPIIKYSLNFIDAFDFLVYRFLLAGLLLLIPMIIAIKKHLPAFKKNFSTYLLLGLLGTPISLIISFHGIELTSAIDASLISITAPIMIVLGGAFFLKETITKREKTGLIIALFGTFLTLIQPLFETQAQGSIKGNLLVMTGTLLWCLFTLLTKKKQDLNPFILAGFSYLIGAVLFLPLFYLINQPAANLMTFNPKALPGILFMAIPGSLIAFFTYLWGLKKIEASEASIFTYLQPIFAVPLAIVLLKETITLPFMVGAFFISLGVYISETR